MATVINRALYANVGGGQKLINSLYDNIGCSHKTISSAYTNIGCSRNAYPDNGISGNYWYVFVG